MHNNRRSTDEKSKLEILKSIKLCEIQKAKIAHAVHDIEQKAERRLHLSKVHAIEQLHRMLDGRTTAEAIAHYDETIACHKQKLAAHQYKEHHEQQRHHSMAFAALALVVLLAGLGFVFLGEGGITGLVVENATDLEVLSPEENITLPEENITIPENITNRTLEDITNITLENVTQENITLENMQEENASSASTPLFDITKIDLSELDATSIPSMPVSAKKLKKDKSVEEILADMKQSYDSKRIKEIKQLSYSSEEITFNDKTGKALIIHQPMFEGQTFEIICTPLKIR